MSSSSYFGFSADPSAWVPEMPEISDPTGAMNVLSDSSTFLSDSVGDMGNIPTFPTDVGFMPDMGFSASPFSAESSSSPDKNVNQETESISPVHDSSTPANEVYLPETDQNNSTGEVPPESNSTTKGASDNLPSLDIEDKDEKTMKNESLSGLQETKPIEKAEERPTKELSSNSSSSNNENETQNDNSTKIDKDNEPQMVSNKEEESKNTKKEEEITNMKTNSEKQEKEEQDDDDEVKDNDDEESVKAFEDKDVEVKEQLNKEENNQSKPTRIAPPIRALSFKHELKNNHNSDLSIAEISFRDMLHGKKSQLLSKVQYKVLVSRMFRKVVNSKDLDSAFKVADTDNDGKINEEEFVALIDTIKTGSAKGMSGGVLKQVGYKSTDARFRKLEFKEKYEYHRSQSFLKKQMKEELEDNNSVSTFASKVDSRQAADMSDIIDVSAATMQGGWEASAPTPATSTATAPKPLKRTKSIEL